MQLCDFVVGEDKPLFFIAGPCVIESEGLILDTASQLKAVSDELAFPLFSKAPSIKPIGHLSTAIVARGSRKGCAFCSASKTN